MFTDINGDSFNLAVPKARAVLDRHPKVKAIMRVHLFNACVQMDPVVRMARERGIAVIEDAAQAIGAEMQGR